MSELREAAKRALALFDAENVAALGDDQDAAEEAALDTVDAMEALRAALTASGDTPRDGLREALTLIREVCDAPIEAFGGSHRVRMVVIPAIVEDALIGEHDRIDAIRIGLRAAVESSTQPEPSDAA